MRTTAAALAMCVAASAGAQIADPLPAPVLPDGLALRLLDYVQIPDSGTPPAPARVNLGKPAGDGSGRLFVNDQRGYLYSVAWGEVTLYLDLVDRMPDFLPEAGYGTGFHSFAFHPEFASNGLFYTVHLEPPGVAAPDLYSPTTVDPQSHSVLTEWQAANSVAATFSGTHRQVLRIEQPTTAHTVQEIAFNPTAAPGDEDYGLLYIGQGDGGRLNNVNPQSPATPLGKILRIDPLGSDGAGGGYGIPPQNPFADDGDAQTLGEVWAYGLRNPHRMSWDSGGSHAMFIGDIGQNNLEEINLGVAGGNYGWNEREGTFRWYWTSAFDVYALPPDDAQFGYLYPVAQYDHDEGNAIVGGFAYRGARIPELAGRYLFGDIVNGRVFHVAIGDLVLGSQATVHELTLVDATGAPVTLLGLLDDVRADLRFGRDERGELYILTKTDGRVRRLVSAIATDSDGDGEPDVSDNCRFDVNPDQRDTNRDGFGNLCDADLDDDGVVNVVDLGLLRSVFFQAGALDADFNGDEVVNTIDLGIMRARFFAAPGPGALLP